MHDLQIRALRNCNAAGKAGRANWCFAWGNFYLRLRRIERARQR